MIGVFDSGLGGLTILKEFLAKLPQYDFMYLGDNARAPYGEKTQDDIYKYTREAVDFLFDQGCELIIIACNTASTNALRKIQQEYLPKKHQNKRVLGVIVPKTEMVLEDKSIKRIGVIGTRATIESGVYKKELQKIDSEIEVFEQACPRLVPLIEEGLAGHEETKKVLKEYLSKFKDKNIDALLLGCTHYPVLIEDIKSNLGEGVRILNSPETVAKKLINYLERHPEIEKRLSRGNKTIFFTTGDPERFKNFGEIFLDNKINKVNKIEL